MRRFLLVISLLLIPTLVFGQAMTTGRVNGHVVDEEGNAVAGARVVFISSSLQGERILTTAVDGKFLAALLPIGPYSVEISAPGMQPVSFSFRIGVGDTVPLDVTLKKGESIVEEVTVYSTATALETTSLGENFSAKLVNELPVVNREIEDIAEYAPNITFGPTPGTLAISGAPSFDTSVLLDGAEISDPYFGGGPTLYLEDAIEEVQVLTAGVSARYGRFQGGVINAVTKTGGNNYDGLLRATYSNESWNSKTPYSQEVQADDLNQFYQLTVGGFILKDHLWWFGGLTEIPDDSDANNTAIATPSDSFTTNSTEDRWQLKLRGAITPDHVIELNHLDFSQSTDNRAALPAGNVEASNGIREDPREINVASYQGVLTPNLFLDLQYTEKSVNILSGGNPNGPDPVFDSAIGGVFNNHWWDFTDPGIRDNETIGLNLTQALSTANWGSHTLEYGVQFVESTTGGENKQSATGFNLLSYSYNINPRSYTGTGGPGAAFWDQDVSPELICSATAQGCNTDADCPSGETCITNVNFQGPGATFGITDRFNVLNYSTYQCGTTGTDNCQVNYRWDALPLGGDQKIENLALYVQETWEVNKWRFDAGLRWDDYDASGPLATQSFAFDEIAPRVGVTYNIDQSWQVQATYGKYVSRFNDGVFNEITGVSAAPRLEQLYAGDNCWSDPAQNVGNTLSDGTTAIDPGMDGCDAGDIAALLRDDGSWGLFTAVVDPLQPSTFNADQIEAPYANDFNFSVKRALPRNSGTIVFTYTDREFKQLMDSFSGAVCDDYNFTYLGGQCNNATDIFDPGGALLATVDTVIWGNSNRAKRDYNAFSVVANWTPSAKWGVGGNYTFGDITGNYEGEGRNTPASGSAIGDHERGFSNSLAYPSGTLDENIRHRLRSWGSYRFNFNRAGSLVLGGVLTYQSGDVYNHEGRTSRSSTPNCAIPSPAGAEANISPGCYTNQGTSFTGIYDGRGAFNFNSWWAFDLSARYDIQLWKELTGWLKIDAVNVLNEGTLTQFQTTGTVSNDGTFNQWGPSGNVGAAGCDSGPSESCTGFGRIRNQNDYQTPREYLFTLGISF